MLSAALAISFVRNFCTVLNIFSFLLLIHRWVYPGQEELFLCKKHKIHKIFFDGYIRESDFQWGWFCSIIFSLKTFGIASVFDNTCPDPRSLDGNSPTISVYLFSLGGNNGIKDF